MQTVKIINPKTSEAVTVETDATTWGELKDELMEMPEFSGLNFDECRVFMKDSQTKSTLGLSSDELSDDDYYKIFVSPIKQKGGGKVRYSPSTIKDVRHKIANILNDILNEGEVPEEEDEDNRVTEEDLNDFEEMV